MQYYAAALIFLTLIGSIVSFSLRSQALSHAEGRAILDRCEAQKKALNQAKRASWLKIGDPIYKRPSTHLKENNSGRSLPIKRLDIMPLFAASDHAFEALVFEFSGMSKELFTAFVLAGRKCFCENRESFDESALFALEFDDLSHRAAYYACLKGEEPLFNRIKVERADAKIPIHQISSRLTRLLFSKESAERVIAHRKAVIQDSTVPLWKEGDLLQLKTKNPLWRERLDVDIDRGRDTPSFKRVRIEKASVDRPTSLLSLEK